MVLDVDLHSHSTHSDGTLDVATLAASMAREGVRVWSLTDHDTTSGWEDAAEQANLHGMSFPSWRGTHVCPGALALR